MGKQELAALNREAAKLRRNWSEFSEMASADAVKSYRHAARAKRRQ